jgi:hypothetical protein
MSDKMKWKEALLLSSMPLEFEAARLLVAEGFSVNSDFQYAWSGGEGLRDSAVDLHASSSLAMPGFDEAVVLNELLINCAPRHPDVSWLFLPDLNTPEFSTPRGGSTIRMIDQFSPYVISQKPAAAFDAEMPLCYRGIEINMATGEDAGPVFNRGILKLQHSLPRLLTENTFAMLTGPRKMNMPFLFCPVLVTSAPLYVIQKEVSTEDIRAASGIEEVASPAPCLIMYSDFSPDFKTRCMNEAEALKPLLRSEKVMEIEMKKVRHYNSHSNLPFTIIEALNAADFHYLNTLFTRFIVCTQNHFPDFVRGFKQAVHQSLENLEPLT